MIIDIRFLRGITKLLKDIINIVNSRDKGNKVGTGKCEPSDKISNPE